MTGLRVWDAGGNLQLDVTTRMTRVLGAFTTGTGATGSYTDASLGSQSVWYAVVGLAATSNEESYSCVFSVSGTTISWSWPSSATIQSLVVCYGTF